MKIFRKGNKIKKTAEKTKKADKKKDKGKCTRKDRKERNKKGKTLKRKINGEEKIFE